MSIPAILATQEKLSYWSLQESTLALTALLTTGLVVTLKCQLSLSNEASGRPYTYLWHTGLQGPAPKVSDLVVVPISNNGAISVTQAIVMSVDKGPDLNMDLSDRYKWAICTIDTSRWEQVIDTHHMALQNIRSIMQKRQIERMKEHIHEVLGVSSDQLLAAPASNGG